MELDSTMSYFGDKLQVSLENAGLFVVMELVQAPSVGEIDRAGFVKGWTAVRCDTISSQADLLKHRISQLSTDMALFKKVYRHAFVAGRERDQKALSLENALVYWGMLFTEPGWRWESQNHNWLDYWKDYLSEKWTRTVSRDMWNMVLEFAFKSVEDETLSFWSEDGAWPSVIDDFVDWCKKKGITKTDSMEIDASS
ncbi:DCN1-like protein 1/2 [Geosmithia morbida]|uniref:Defective in cullin neddylation protein n=1 Tax=Geosmithia morbida TaxID=1094350 RepID=A0A9P4YMP9_9HYPO|nr:DCN1-like protein 1/2 [Geosmithia morbida]KAF4119796.1 DCN1-like protein 1/2 [Geosmithia morbida]